MSSTNNKLLEGVVVSDKMQKTVVVRIDRSVRHATYEKQIKRSTRLQVHDEQGQCKVGDRVIVEQCRPLSKCKAWRLFKLMETKSSLVSAS